MDLLPLTPEKSARRQPPASKKLKEFFDKQKEPGKTISSKDRLRALQ